MRRASLILLVLVFRAVPAYAQSFDLLDKRVPIAEHVKRNSNVKLTLSTGAEAEIPDTILLPEVGSQPNGVGTFDVVPRCERSQVRREPLLEYSEGSEAIDLVYFDHSDPDQVKRAETWPGVVVPYLDSAVYNPYAEQDRLQCFARVLTLRCLPTRFRFTEFEGRRVSEFREGSSAWDLDAN